MATNYNSQAAFFRNTNSQYEVSGMTYPADLLGASSEGTNQYGENYVMFNINVHSDSRLNTAESTIDIPNVTTRVGRQIEGQQLTVAEAGVGQIGQNLIPQVAGGTLGIGQLGALATNTALSAVVTGNTTDTSLGDVFRDPSGSLNRQAGRSQRRLVSAIALHIPNNLTTRYSVQYEEASTYGFQAMAQVARGMGEAGGSLMQAFANGNTEGLGGRLMDALRTSQAGNSLTGAILQSDSGRAISALTGVAANPKKEQVFSQVDFRTFTFDYQFYPRSETEANNVLEIIKTFKTHMHPEFKAGTDFLYIYPAEFDIAYYTGGSQNVAIHRHASCVLTEMNINYSPQGQFTTFANGVPTQINISLTFRELVPMTKETLAQMGEIDTLPAAREASGNVATLGDGSITTVPPRSDPEVPIGDGLDASTGGNNLI